MFTSIPVTHRVDSGERPTTGEGVVDCRTRRTRSSGFRDRWSGAWGAEPCFQIEREPGDGPMDPLHLSDRRWNAYSTGEVR